MALPSAWQLPHAPLSLAQAHSIVSRYFSEGQVAASSTKAKLDTFDGARRQEKEGREPFDLLRLLREKFPGEILVRKVGFEPTRLSAPPPQDGVSASSTTSAGGCNSTQVVLWCKARPGPRADAPGGYFFGGAAGCAGTDCWAGC